VICVKSRFQFFTLCAVEY